MITAEAMAWLRIATYLYLAATMAQVATFTSKLRRALYATALSFILQAVGAFALACGQSDIRDSVLIVATFYMLIVCSVWLRTLWKSGKVEL